METKTIETPFQKAKVEIKTYLTAGDEQEIQKVLYDAAIIKNGAVEKIEGSKGEVMNNMERKLMEKAVVSINDNKDKIVERLLEMPSKDYDFVKDAVDKIRDEGGEAKKK